jgi:hypothetical protein
LSAAAIGLVAAAVVTLAVGVTRIEARLVGASVVCSAMALVTLLVLV